MIKEELYKLAKSARACHKELRELKKTQSTGEMVQLYLDNIKFCLSRDYPGNAYVRRLRQPARSKGVFLDEKVRADNLIRGVFLGNCRAVLDCNGASACRYYVKHDSQVTINASGFTHVVIDVFDEATITVNASQKSKVYVYKMNGGKVIDNGGGGLLKVIEGDLKSYLNGG